MRKSKLIKVVALVVCVFMFATVMVGCGSSSSSSADASTSGAAAATATASGAAATNPADLKGALTFWHFNKDEAPNIEADFKKKFPNVKLNVQITPDTKLAYQNKVASALRAGTGMPDALAVESAFARRFINMEGLYDDLNAAPYNAGEITKNMVPYTLQIGTDKGGKLRALSHQATPGGIGYKRDMATKYLGTDDPDKISEMLSSADKMLETAKKLSDASQGKAKLWVGFEDVYQMYRGGRESAWIVDNKLVIDPKMTDFLDFGKKLRDGKYEGAMRAWVPSWNAAAADNIHMCYCIPTWGIPVIIVGNDKANEGKGRWGIAKAPFNYFWGGTWYGVYSKSQVKDLAWAFVKWFTSDKDQLKGWAKDHGDFVNNTEIINELQSDDSFINKTINQNPYKIFGPMVSSINGSIFTEQDDNINQAWLTFSETFLTGKISKDEMLKQFKAKVKNDLPDLTVE